MAGGRVRCTPAVLTNRGGATSGVAMAMMRAGTRVGVFSRRAPAAGQHAPGQVQPPCAGAAGEW